MEHLEERLQLEVSMLSYRGHTLYSSLAPPAQQAAWLPMGVRAVVSQATRQLPRSGTLFLQACSHSEGVWPTGPSPFTSGDMCSLRPSLNSLSRTLIQALSQFQKRTHLHLCCALESLVFWIYACILRLLLVSGELLRRGSRRRCRGAYHRLQIRDCHTCRLRSIQLREPFANWMQAHFEVAWQMYSTSRFLRARAHTHTYTHPLTQPHTHTRNSFAISLPILWGDNIHRKCWFVLLLKSSFCKVCVCVRELTFA